MSEAKLNVRVYPIDEPKGNTKAFANIAVDDLIVIRGIRVVDSEKGLFVTMPQSQDKKTNEYHDIAFPLTADLRKGIVAAVLDEYDRTVNLPPNKRSYDSPDISTATDIDFKDVKLDVRVYPIDEPKGNVKAFASVSVNDIAIRGIRVIEGEKGTFVSMPQTQDKKTNEYHDVAFPISGDLRKEINKAVLEEYKAAEKTTDKSLANGLKKGAEKAVGAASESRESAAKSRKAGMLE